MLARLRRRFASLTARLVITAVILVAVVALSIATVTTFAMRASLLDRLDEDVRELADRPPSVLAPSGGDLPDFRRTAPGTLEAVVEQEGTIAGVDQGEDAELSEADLDLLADVPVDGQVHTVRLPGHGDYRVVADDERLVLSETGSPVTYVTGLPLDDVDETVRNLVAWEVALSLLGILVAAGAGLVVVRRQLRPLTEIAHTAHLVAEKPLDSGAIDLAERVPDHLTDPDTEVGQVGLALNTLLAHVETSLDARHRSEQQVRQFVADASHELRTPLTTISGYTQLARRRGDTETASTALAKVEEEAGRMTSLVEDLLLLARLDAGRPLASAAVDLSRLAVEAVADARVVAPEHRWLVEIDQPDDPGPVEVVGDDLRLHQVLTNLLTNARKYTPSGTTVRVVVRHDGFEVHDDGPGFPPDLAATAFERFTRGDTARQRQGGVGLGLALVRAIVTAHGGRVDLVSRPGDTTIAVSGLTGS